MGSGFANFGMFWTENALAAFWGEMCFFSFSAFSNDFRSIAHYFVWAPPVRESLTIFVVTASQCPRFKQKQIVREALGLLENADLPKG